MMKNALGYLRSTESAVRMLLQEAVVYRAKVEAIQDSIISGDVAPKFTVSPITFGDWWMANKNDKDAIFRAHRTYLVEAFTAGILAGAVLKIAAQAIDNYSENTLIPGEWAKILRKGFSPHSFFVGRALHTVPIGLIIYCGLNQHLNTINRTVENINHEVFERLGAEGNKFEFQAFVDRSSDYKRLHSEYFASNVLDILGWTDYNHYIADMNEILC